MKKIILLLLVSLNFSVVTANNHNPTLVLLIGCNDSVEGVKIFNDYTSNKDLCEAFDIRLGYSVENEIKIYHKDSNILLATIFGTLPTVERLNTIYKERFNPIIVEDIVSKVPLITLYKNSHN
jgi:hypothetical protein